MTAKDKKAIIKLKELIAEIPHLRTLKYGQWGSGTWNSEYVAWRKRAENIIVFALNDDDYQIFSRSGKLTDAPIMGDSVLQSDYDKNLTSCKNALQTIIDKYELLEDDIPSSEVEDTPKQNTLKQDIDSEAYDVALSFAGEDREYVAKVAAYLKDKGIRVFYDNFEQIDMWGKDLFEYLEKIYRNDSRYCVIFISKDYIKKVYTNHERRSALAKALQKKDEYILPVRFDDTPVPGILPTVNYIDLTQKKPSELGQMIIDKIRKNN